MYDAKGFANFGAVQAIAIDETRHVVDITIEVEEGSPVSFGSSAAGRDAEPMPGEGRVLLTAWKEVQGKLLQP